MPESSKSLLISSKEFEPAYMKLFRTGELYRRSRQALRHLENCKVCPRDCEVNRLEDIDTGVWGDFPGQIGHAPYPPFPRNSEREKIWRDQPSPHFQRDSHCQDHRLPKRPAPLRPALASMTLAGPRRVEAFKPLPTIHLGLMNHCLASPAKRCSHRLEIAMALYC